MRIVAVFMVLIALLGCQSTGTAQRAKSPVMKQLLAPKSQEIEAHSLSNYINRAAELASKKGYQHFALVSKLNSKQQQTIWVYLYNNDEDLKSFYQKLQNDSKLNLIDTFSTEESKGRRYLDVDSVPGLA
ncbi:hypothetical protein CGJ34_24405 [Vibrio parahaemolyticus]|uniref:hypothetical protein n=1 Tax=Vibrio parahaemolyticus TaxID=670 RepID=UPI0011204126|nr:hypothetical protein [Vibrio parahaemolyticus]ELB2059145.1 hypothetical protein [Vibrio parahaemolyticus]TOE80366.1 hypothetical protein CGJ34_24405 [Vibrio parahaemolyticus]